MDIKNNPQSTSSETGGSELSASSPKTPQSGAEEPKGAASKIITLEDKPTDAPIEKAKVPPVASEPPAKEDSGISFTNIFNQKKEAPKKETNVISSVLKKKKSEDKLKPILGSVPILQKSVIQEKKIKLKRKLRTVQTIFIVVVMAAIVSAFYFYSELSPTFDIFGQNTTQKLADVNTNLRSVQTNINKYRYLAAQLDLNKFSFVSDEFLDKTGQLTNGTPANSAKVLNSGVSQAVLELPTLLSNIRDNLSPDIVIQTVRSLAEEEMTPDEIRKQAEDDLRAALAHDRTQITKNSVLDSANQQDVKLIENTLKLVGNSSLISSIKSASIESFASNLEAYSSELDPVNRDNLRELMSSILSSTQSDIATIGTLKTNRIEWSTIISRIDEVTIIVDPRSDLSDRALCDVLAICINYTGFDFDTSSNKIVLSGITETINADNFTVMSDLIDELEQSPYFNNVEMRSFSKSGSFEQGFIANFKIDLELETKDLSKSSEQVSLDVRRVARKASVKRTN